MQRILAGHALGFAMGIILGCFFHIPLTWCILMCGAALLFSLLIVLRDLPYVYLVVFTIAIGIFWGQLQQSKINAFPYAPEEKISLIGMVAGEAAPAGTGQVFSVKPQIINGKKYEGPKINLIAEQSIKINYGNIVQAKGKVLEEMTASNPHQFDYQAYLQRQGIGAVVSTMFGGEFNDTGINRGVFFIKAAYAAKKRLVKALSYLPLKQQSFVRGMLFGDKGYLAYEDRNILSQTGLMDAFAVSGVHVGFVMLFGTMIAALVSRNRWSKLIFVVILIGFYAAMTGFTASVVRSSVMGLLGLLAYEMGEEKDFYTALALSALLILIFQSQMVFDSGFQLSFTAAAGVVYLTPKISLWFPGKGSWRQAGGAALAAHITLLPLMAYYFNTVTFCGIFISLLGAGLVGVVVFLGLFSVSLSLVSITIASYPLYGAGLLTELIYRGAKIAAEIPGSFKVVGTPSLGLISFYYGGLLLFPLIFKENSKKCREVIAVGFLVLLFFVPPVWGEHCLKVTFLDVGQGDCALIQTTSGKYMMIDGGGKSGTDSPDIGERIVVPYLKSAGISKLDFVAATHPHDDHIQGLFAVLKEMRVERLLLAAPFYQSPEMSGLISLAKQKGVKISYLSRGDQIQVGPDEDILVLHPGEPLSGTNSDANNNSLVFHFRYREVAFLFTGDVEMEALQEILDSGQDLRADVLKIMHHGSKNGFFPDFYQEVSPKMAVISVGKNTFGHPVREVLDYWDENNVLCLRTDKCGAVQVYSDGKSLQYKTTRFLDKMSDNWENQNK